ncbi:MAG: hypothetical protein JRI68_22570 [Deltaproteobacteria bacterium]|nr:hypothetical protein [Deltaproteobacteria bacterium]
MRLFAVLSSLVLAATGCSAAVVDDDGEDVEAAEALAHGSVAVEQTISYGTATPGVRTYVSARFVRLSGLDVQTAESVVGSAARLDPDAPLGCAWYEGQPSSAFPEAIDGSIELLDVGDIFLRAGSTATPLVARAFPDVGELVSGVVYTSRGHDISLPAATTYSIETSGSDFVDGFSMQVEAPEGLEGVRLSQPAVGIEAQPFDSAELTVVVGEGLTLVWEPGSPSAGDRIYVDVGTVDDEPAAGRLRCVFDDQGTGMLPAPAGKLQAGGEIEIAVHRHRLVTAKPSGIDEAVVDFDFAVTARALLTE